MTFNKVQGGISLFQYVMFISQVQIGVGMMTLPTDLAEVAGTDGWISILLGWIAAIVISLVIVRIMSRQPAETIYDLFFRYLGRGLGACAVLLFILYCLFVFTIAILVKIHITQTWVLPQTPNFFLMLLFMIPILMLVHFGVNILVRYVEFVGLGTIVIIPLFFIAMKGGHLIHLLPVLKEGWLPVFQGVKTTVLSFLGFELAFILYPLLRQKNKAAKGIIIANTITMCMQMLVVITCYIQFNPYQILTYIWPTLDLFETVEFPFVERIEVIFTAFYLFLISTSGIPYLYTAIAGIERLFGDSIREKAMLVLGLGYIVSAFIYNPTFYQVNQMQKWGGNIGMFVAYLFPIAFWLYAGVVDRIRRWDKT
ncbi:endospore germination permease [Brevibacillus brevis]|uniref:Endospore germination permease n=1 Tax=Brevibacillus brevis TaxID=1393 RepID=A0ABY9SYU6_BREBE|nr:endospore germination permease [Brevibacillus brevis]WNC12186.1 endospore germination permease [Brevibacillus brevis]